MCPLRCDGDVSSQPCKSQQSTAILGSKPSLIVGESSGQVVGACRQGKSSTKLDPEGELQASRRAHVAPSSISARPRNLGLSPCIPRSSRANNQYLCRRQVPTFHDLPQSVCHHLSSAPIMQRMNPPQPQSRSRLGYIRTYYDELRFYDGRCDVAEWKLISAAW